MWALSFEITWKISKLAYFEIIIEHLQTKKYDL